MWLSDTRPLPPLNSSAPAKRSTRLSGLDGLRALAVAAVVFYHLDISLAPGGFLGVDVFFVISGFLITRLLCTEVTTTGTIWLSQFYWRRARRLLPAVAALLAVVSLASIVVWRDQLATLQGALGSSLAYVTNWWLIADHQSYFVASGRPSMLQHLWSLAIEEQFYLVWSVLLLVITGGALRSRRERERPVRLHRVVWLALILAVASTVAMGMRASSGHVPYVESPSRIYLGTDTHSMGLFLGSAAGALWVIRSRRVNVPAARRGSDWAGDVVGLAMLAVLCYLFVHLSEFNPSLYRGGFLLIDAIALLVVCAVVRSGSRLGRALDVAPMRWVGERSYSIYLWHWPVVVVTRPGLDVHGPVFLLNIARLGLILALSAVSYRFVECPLRAGGRSWHRPSTASIERRRGFALLRISAVLVAVIGLLLASTPLVRHENEVSAAVHNVISPKPALSSSSPPAESPTPTPTVRAQPPLPAKSTAVHAAPTSSPARPTAAAPVAPPPPLSISAFGDSVLLGAAPAIEARVAHLGLDSVEGRQAYVVLDDVVQAHANNSLAPVVLIHTGNNGVISPDQLASTLAALSDRAKIILMTDRVPRDWQDANNATIRTIGARFKNVVVVDWFARSAGQSSWFWSDGFHVDPTGAAAYAQIVLAAIAG